MNIRRTISTEGLAFVLALLLAPALGAQPCSIAIGADTVICQGGSANLKGPPAYGNYLWSTGASSQNISVTAAGDYWCQVSYLSANLVTNGDFSGGNTGFSSQFTYSTTNVQNEGYYAVGTNAHLYHTQFQGTGNGNFFIGNAGYVSWVNGQHDIWCQTIPCCPGQTYTLSFSGMTLSNALPARVAWNMDGVQAAWPDMTFPAYGAGWQQYNTTWTAGPGQTSVTACITITSGDGVGDDFGIDNISISGTIVLRDTVHVSVTPLPNVNLGNNFALCNGESTNLDATVPGGTYLWQDGSISPGYHVTSLGNYSVTVTANNCSNSDNVSIAYNPLPVVQLGPDTTLCVGSSLNLSAFAPGSTYLWQGGSTASNFTVGAPGLYWAEVTRNNCSARDSINVSYNPLPVVSLGNDTVICAGSPLTLNATVVGGSYEWQDGSTGPTFPVITSGNYQVTVDLNGCTAQDAMQVNVTPLPVADIGPDTTVCPGSTVIFDATTAGASYLWSDATTWPTLTTTISGNYSVQVTVNGCSASDAATLSNFNLQLVNLGTDRTICEGETTTVGVAVPGATYLWNTGAITDSVQVSAAGTYWVDATLNGCIVRDSIGVSVTPLPVVDIGPDLQVCPASQATLDATIPGGTYLWNNGAVTPTITVGAGAWSVDVTVNGCTASDAANITDQTPPVVDLGPDQIVCPGYSATFDATTPNATYLWNDGTTEPTLTTSVPGNYSVQVTVNGCSTSDAAALSNFSLQSVSLGPDHTICAGETTTVGIAVPGAIYLWNTGAITDSVQVSTTGIYWVDATLNGCAVRDSIDVSVTPLPIVNLGPDLQVCPASQATLDATIPGGTYLWNNGAVTPTITVGAGAWSVDVTVNGCTASDAANITDQTPPVVDLGPDQIICPGNSATFNATTPNATYLWNDGSTGPTLTTSVPGNYSVQVTVNGCSTSDAAALSNFNLQSVSLGPDRTICAGETATIGVNVPGATYTWNTGATADSLHVATSGTYWVDAALNGCAARDSINVSVTPLPVANIGPDQQVCPAAQAILDATLPGATYLWSNGGVTPTITVGAGTWSVDVTVNGCTASDAAIISNLTPPVVDLGPDTVLCPNASIILDAGPYGTGYLWSTGATSQSITVTSAMSASVSVTDVHGCSSADVIIISYASPVPISLGPDISVCAGEMVMLDATTAGADGYLWSDGTTDAILSTINAGTYFVAVSQGNCATGDTINIQIVSAPSTTLGNDTTLCPGETMNLHVSSAGATFVWQDGSTANDLVVQAAGDYWVAATDAAGCLDTAFVHVGYLASNAFDLGPDTVLCSGEMLLLDAGLPGGTTAWSGAITATSASVQADLTGTYVATTTVTGCSFTDSVHISVVSPPAINLGADQSMCAGSTVQLTATAPSLLWDDGSSANTRTIHQGGTYWAQATDSGCSASDTVTVVEIPLPILDLGTDTNLCTSGLLLLNATVPGGSYLWNDGSTAFQRMVGPGEWVVQVSALGCSSSDSILINALPSPVLSLPQDTTLCTGTAWTMDVAQPGSAYLWSTGAVTPSLTVDAPGTYGVTVDRGGCTASAQVEVAYVDLSNFSLGPDTVLCPGDIIQLSVDVPGASVVWQDGSTDMQRSVSTEGTYQANIAVGGCTSQASVHVGITALPEADLGSDRTLCIGDTLWLSIQPGAAQVEWSTGASGDSARVTTSGNYSVSLALDGCISSDVTHVTFLPIINALDLGPDMGICPGMSITLDATIPGASYTWNDGSHLPELQVQSQGTYHVIATGPCINATDTIIFTEGACTPVVHVPNAFTPDGDDINDRFTPVVFEPVRQWSFMVFDRWGERIFTTDKPGDGWDGTVDGKEAPVGVYVWDLQFEAVTDEGVVQERKRGSVTLVR